VVEWGPRLPRSAADTDREPGGAEDSVRRCRQRTGPCGQRLCVANISASQRWYLGVDQLLSALLDCQRPADLSEDWLATADAPDVCQ